MTLCRCLIDRFSRDITMPIVWFLLPDRSKVRPFKSMVKLLHTLNFKQPLYSRLVDGVFCLILLLFEGPKLRNSISGYFRG